MKKNFIFALAALAAALLLAAVVFFSAAMLDTLVIGKRPNPADTVSDFFDYLGAEDYRQAMELVENYDTLCFETKGSEVVEQFKDNLIKSYHLEVVGEAKISGLDAVQTINLTFLDSRLLFADASVKASETAMEFKNNGGVIDSDEQAMKFFNESLTECMTDSEAFYSTESIDVELYYNGKEWEIVMTDELLNAVCGNFGAGSAEGAAVNE